jgi:HK97 family phage major capsid protein/HK97 family phage prohead protease
MMAKRLNPKRFQRRSVGGVGAMECRAVEGGPTQIVGYAAVFNTVAYAEVIRPGAFTKTLSERGDVRAYWNHDSSAILGRTSNGTLLLREDETGLYCEITPNANTSWGRDALASVEREDVKGMSFGFRVLKSASAVNGGAEITELLELDLREVSPCTDPWYEATNAESRDRDDGIDESADESEPGQRTHSSESEAVVDESEPGQRTHSSETADRGLSLALAKAELDLVIAEAGLSGRCGQSGHCGHLASHRLAIERVTRMDAKAKRREVIQAMQAIMRAADEDGKRDLTAAESAEFERLKGESAALTLRIARDDEMERHAALIGDGVGRNRGVPEPEGGRGSHGGADEFRSIGDFVQCVARGQDDPRLRAVTTQDGGVGYLIPSQFHNEILMLDPLEEVMAPRATIIPPGVSPDAKESWPALEQGDGGFMAGFTFEWTGENATTTESAPKLINVETNPHELVGTIDLSNKVLRNAGAYSGFIQMLLKRGMSAIRDKAFIAGDGVAKPLGILRSACRITVKRTTASTVKYADIMRMIESIPPQFIAQAMWLNTTNSLAAIEGMVDTYGRPIFGTGDISQGRPKTIQGIELKYTDQAATFGSEGDLNLVVPKTYLYKQGYGPAIAIGEPEFKKGLTTLRIIMSLDGQCWVPQAVTLDNGATVSPVVSLK